ncbi:hypothetical protein CC85DRAFT_285413 [Cutaneotrichosporon oleaginosum]|uniref:Uncharacterized protein n=1 Tax=Cutaneotrichosporon oleaginosum TaxID=879819 RepID=A0A0J1B4C9_9TREE|nr:uncharacterized protein CC85DRAFT_285413 [Cutaneotrichosporon oleaginosum]KLT42504.1 hypothetical protein CC85DRAFT_285413 [Cutaneotrichosporon oleaginosum]TXT07777.1 hypothetical protein COLE_04701 [Cutaneotrichosporon oleaginosum]
MTVAFYLDAAPMLSDLGLPFRAGLDDIISLVPIWGDIISGIMQLYQVWLAWIFGVPVEVCVRMIINVLLDTAVGIIPFVGDILDNLWKANLRNLALLEDWLLTAPQYHILLMPDSTTYLPEPKKSGRWNAWFGPTGKREAEDELERERATGHIRRTRRMAKDEGEYAFGAKVPAGNRTAPDVASEPLN